MAYVLVVSNLHVFKIIMLPLVAPVVTVGLSFFIKTFISLLELCVVVFVVVFVV